MQKASGLGRDGPRRDVRGDCADVINSRPPRTPGHVPGPSLARRREVSRAALPAGPGGPESRYAPATAERTPQVSLPTSSNTNCR